MDPSPKPYGSKSKTLKIWYPPLDQTKAFDQWLWSPGFQILYNADCDWTSNRLRTNEEQKLVAHALEIK